MTITAFTDVAFAELPAGTFAYRRWGGADPGRPVAVLLHGNADSSAAWARVGPVLAEGFTVYALDLRGHGASATPPAGRYELDAAADDVRAFLDALELRSPLLVGHSWGAAIALLVAVGSGDSPARPLRGLVLEELPPEQTLDFYGAERVRRLQAVVGAAPEEIREFVSERHRSWHPVDLDTFIYGLTQVDSTTVRAVSAEGASQGPLLPLLAELTVPTLLLRADPRQLTILNDTDWVRARDLLPVRAGAVQIADAAHDIHRTAFDEFVRAVEEFLRETNSSPKDPAGERPSAETSAQSPRITPLPAEEVGRLTGGRFQGEALAPLFGGAGAAVLGDKPPLNLVATVAHDPDLLIAVAPLLLRVANGRLPARDREIVVLRVAGSTGSRYVGAIHRRVATELGMSEQEIDAATTDPEAREWTEHDAALVRAVDELRGPGATVTDETWRRLGIRYDEPQLLELLALVGAYTLVAGLANSCGMPVDEWLGDPAGSPDPNAMVGRAGGYSK
ncbi:alpha/beta fold hydrolase [Nocardia mexicana]|uniref:Alpha-beta hydrolase superfamily lysophospholipase n=1 Tax=Nocardia mexicana TaxID=279262 RepID=A0A370H5H7_9NOCA|nr:alpha/beta fold hydrolase [Nocardia mexicana]RDI50742.1 alpha-beta hydrolase superfamily lysophospholipase [Nocardia mexicana]